MLKHKKVVGMLEYAADKLVISTIGGAILLISDWEVVREIPELNKFNLKKEHFVPLPGFDIDKLPFIVCSGSATINLINVRDHDSKAE